MSDVTDRSNHPHCLDFVWALDRTSFHHGGHSIDPVDAAFLKCPNHVQIHEVDTNRLVGDSSIFEIVHQCIAEFRHLSGGGRACGAFNPRVRVPHVLFRNPRRVLSDVVPDIALLIQNRLFALGKYGIPKTRLQLVPPRRHCRGDVADVLVVHQQHRTKAVAFHCLACTLQAPLTDLLPVDAFTPVGREYSECFFHFFAPRCWCSV